MKNRLRQLRKQHSWTQQALADQLAVSRQTINAIENRRYDPSLSLALKISEIFKQPIEAIFSSS